MPTPRERNNYMEENRTGDKTPQPVDTTKETRKEEMQCTHSQSPPPLTYLSLLHLLLQVPLVLSSPPSLAPSQNKIPPATFSYREKNPLPRTHHGHHPLLQEKRDIKQANFWSGFLGAWHLSICSLLLMNASHFDKPNGNPTAFT
ncbi:hypothetical protein Fcan01_03917 [Folsomia candida]|uniref:Uncharacterized protein n=1 Tax=Folsomia candida TaxID=158441 RepID=A0A226EYI1_FOLCA|nr:hypothetical protein Fcan01_03917 [Folsomia candida]